MAGADILGLMVESMWVSGLIILCMAKGAIHERTEDIMRASTGLIKSMDLEYIIGRMVEFIEVVGKMENNMEKESIFLRIRSRKRVSGKMGEGFAGWIEYYNKTSY